MSSKDIAEELIKAEESYSEFPYEDTNGYLTAGWGQNLDTRGISRGAAQYMLDEAIAEAMQDLQKIFPGWFGIDEIRQAVLIDLHVNMGPGNDQHGFRSFHNMIAAVKVGDYEKAALNLKYKNPDNTEAGFTDWWHEVKIRGPKLYNILLKGVISQ